MIDTAVLSVQLRQGDIVDPTKFAPRVTESFLRLRNRSRAVQNPTKREAALYGYLPRLTLVTAPPWPTLIVEASLPKLLRDNNLQELSDSDLGELTKVLSDQLVLMGVSLTADRLAAASVSRIHYSKNVPLSGEGISPLMVIADIQKLDLPSRLDLNRTSFRNGGLSLSVHSNRKEVAFYDKYYDIKRSRISPKRSVGGAEPVGNIERFRDILRFEVRLNSPSVIRESLRKIGVKAERTLSGLFSSSIAQAILLHEWATIERQLSFSAFSQEGPVAAAQTIIARGVSPKTALELTGAITLMSEIGATQLRNLLESKKGRGGYWNRLKRRLREHVTLVHKPFVSLIVIKRALQHFTPLQL